MIEEEGESYSDYRSATAGKSITFFRCLRSGLARGSGPLIVPLHIRCGASDLRNDQVEFCSSLVQITA